MDHKGLAVVLAITALFLYCSYFIILTCSGHRSKCFLLNSVIRLNYCYADICTCFISKLDELDKTHLVSVNDSWLGFSKIFRPTMNGTSFCEKTHRYRSLILMDSPSGGVFKFANVGRLFEVKVSVLKEIFQRQCLPKLPPCSQNCWFRK